MDLLLLVKLNLNLKILNNINNIININMVKKVIIIMGRVIIDLFAMYIHIIKYLLLNK
jgi:hypothetical protein